MLISDSVISDSDNLISDSVTVTIEFCTILLTEFKRPFFLYRNALDNFTFERNERYI